MQRPFDLHTAKRMRLAHQAANENDESARRSAGKRSVSSAGCYEPLCKQLERNFRLRASDEKPCGGDKPRTLTKPISPNLQLD